MAKAGMKRPDPESIGNNQKGKHYKKNDVAPVPELSGKIKTGKKKAKPK